MNFLSTLWQTFFWDLDIGPNEPPYINGVGNADDTNFIELRDQLRKEVVVINRLLFVTSAVLLTTAFFIFYSYLYKNQVQLEALINSRLGFFRTLLDATSVRLYDVSIFDARNFFPIIQEELKLINDIPSYIDSIRNKILNKEMVDESHPLEFAIYQMLITDQLLHLNCDLLSEHYYYNLVKIPVSKLLEDVLSSYDKFLVIEILSR